MSWIDREYDVICGERVITTFDRDEIGIQPWSLRKDALITLANDEREDVFQVVKTEHTYEPGLLPKSLPTRGKLHVRPYLRNYEHGIA